MKKKPIDEPKFELSLVVGASLLGTVLAFLDNRAEVGMRLVKEVAAGGNTPKGAFMKAFVELLKTSGPMKIQAVKENMTALGFSKGSVDTTFYSARIKKLYTRKGDMIHLKRGVA